jgi:predicted nucleic acid-binding protein
MGKRYLIDTNIIPKYLQESLSEDGLTLIDNILDSGEAQISVITRIELLGFSPNREDLLQFITQFINVTTEYELTEMIVQKTIEIRKSFKVKIPDAIIAATALCHNLILLSDNDSDFGKILHLKYINPRKYQV